MIYKWIWNLSEWSGIGLGRFAPFVFGKMIGSKGKEVRECLCMLCDKEYPVWYADNEIWNAVMRYPDGREASEKIPFVCISCFIKEAERLKTDVRVWHLSVDK